MAIVVDAPQGPQVSSGSQLIAVASLTAVGNALPVPINGAAVLSVDNRSNATILIQLLTASQGISSPYVEIIDPGQKRAFSYQLPMTEVIISNATFKGLPAPFLDFLFPALPADQNKTSGFVVLSWTSVPLSIDDGQNDGVVTITTATGAVFDIENTPGGLLGANMPNVYLGSAPAVPCTTPNTVVSRSFALDPSFSSVSIGNNSAFGTNAIVSVTVTGDQSGMIFATFSPTPQKTPLIALLGQMQDNSFTVTVTTSGTCGVATPGYVWVTANRVPTLSVPQNFGNAPLIVQPASGSSQTVVPGTAAGNYLSSTTPAGVQNNLGGVLAKPTSVYSLCVAAEMSVVAAGAAPATDGIIAFGYQGVTSGKIVLLAVLGVNIPAITAAGTVKGSNSQTIVYPFPLSMASLFPNDTQLQGMYQANFVVANSMLTMLTN